MPKKLDWKFLCVKKLTNSNSFKVFQESQLCAMVDKNNKSKCNVCDSKNLFGST